MKELCLLRVPINLLLYGAKSQIAELRFVHKKLIPPRSLGWPSTELTFAWSKQSVKRLTLIPTAVTIYRSHYFKAKFLKKSLNNINLRKIANP
jgi:hypothetical protein